MVYAGTQPSESNGEQRFQPITERIPPQNIDAEEAILGSLLLDPEAISRVVDVLKVDAFYLNAHREIYRTALTLHSQGKPTDLTTMAAWLQDLGKLEQVGGQSKLAQLLDRIISTANVDQYAELVMDKYTRRQLIKSGNEVIALGYDTKQALSTILQESEQKIFALTQDRARGGLTSTSEILTQTFHEMESRSLGTTLSGIPCNFYDLDGLTQGFQRSDLIIVAGRPAMGKTSFVLNIARNIAVIHRLPICIYSLEMSKEQLVYRLLSSEVCIESGRLRSGRITTEEWAILAQALGNLSELPIYIDDTPDMTVNEMRSKARRLQSEQGGKLGLVLIDYLQLMEGASPDNRVQELSKITRSLKGMARELNAPVMTLSQLSRGVESRTNKRPMMSDLRESGCLTGDTLITLADSGKRIPLQNLIGHTDFQVWAINPKTWKLEKATVSNSFCTGEKPVFRLTTQLGRKIRATENHKFLTLAGWKRLDQLKEQDYIALPRQLIALPALKASNMKHREFQSQLNMSYCGSTLLKQNLSRDRAGKISQVLDSAELEALAQSDVYWDKIASLEADGYESVYDLTVPGLHNFVGNDIIVHNSIEQDADLILMLYRDEYYNPDSVDRGVAEVIITKHRNGPVGTVKLLFEPQFTRFRNMANPN